MLISVSLSFQCAFLKFGSQVNFYSTFATKMDQQSDLMISGEDLYMVLKAQLYRSLRIPWKVRLYVILMKMYLLIRFVSLINRPARICDD